MRGNRRRRVLVRLMVSGLLLALLYRRAEFARLGGHLAGLRWALAPLLFALLFLNTVLSAAKWKILLAADGIRIPLRDLLGSYLVGTFFNVFLPSTIGGDVYRVVDIGRKSARPVNAFASVFADRLSGFAALAALGVIFPLFGWKLLERHRAVLLLPFATFALIAALLWLLYQQRLLRWCLDAAGATRLPRLRDALDRFLASLAAYRDRPGLFPRVMAISFSFQFSVIAFVWLLAAALRLDVPFLFFCVFVPLISVMEAIPLSIYGLGLRDAGYVLFFSCIGRPREEALALALLYVVATLAYASVGGLVFVCRRPGRTAAERAP